MTVVIMMPVNRVRPAVIGIRARSVVDARPVVIAWAIIVRMACGDRTRGQRAGGKTESEARTYATGLSRRGHRHRGGADGRNRGQNSQCSHVVLLFKQFANQRIAGPQVAREPPSWPEPGATFARLFLSRAERKPAFPR